MKLNKNTLYLKKDLFDGPARKHHEVANSHFKASVSLTQQLHRTTLSPLSNTNSFPPLPYVHYIFYFSPIYFMEGGIYCSHFFNCISSMSDETFTALLEPTS